MKRILILNPIEAVDAYCSFKSLMRDLRSPYLSWMIEDLCHRLLVTAAINHLQDEAEDRICENLLKLIENGLYFSPAHLLLKALLRNELPILESMIDKNVCLRGHVMNGDVFVPLATALMRGTVPMVRALCENGSDPWKKATMGDGMGLNVCSLAFGMKLTKTNPNRRTFRLAMKRESSLGALRIKGK